MAANGARFHLAEAGEGPAVLLLHGFPQFWWTWRHQLPALAGAGYRAIAMDLRGYGASDKPPRGYDTFTLAADVAGVVRALGEPQAVIVGHDWGGWLSWAMPALAPQITVAVAALSMPHPLTVHQALRSDPAQLRAWRRVLGFQLPMRPEHSLTSGDGVADVLAEWSAGAGYPDAELLRRYQRAMCVPFVAHSAMEYYRWALRSLPRRDGRRFARAVSAAVRVPVLQLQGTADPYVLEHVARASRRHTVGDYRWQAIPGAGHFLPEEAPDAVTSALLDWLDTLDQARPRR